MIMQKSTVLLFFFSFFALISAIAAPMLSNKNKYEVFYYKQTYSDGSHNDMICIFDHSTGKWKVEALYE